MIVTEYLNDGTLIKRYSDSGMLIERDGIRYPEAIDPANLDRVYTETNEPIDKEETDEATVSDYIEALSEMGVSVDD